VKPKNIGPTKGKIKQDRQSQQDTCGKYQQPKKAEHIQERCHFRSLPLKLEITFSFPFSKYVKHCQRI